LFDERNVRNFLPGRRISEPDTRLGERGSHFHEKVSYER
jgi:hypothetical protein